MRLKESTIEGLKFLGVWFIIVGGTPLVIGCVIWILSKMFGY